MKIISAAVLTLALLAPIASARAGDAEVAKPEGRLMIVNGNSGRVVYDDGHDDLFCVTRRHIVGYDEDGRPVRRRSMHCR